MKCIFNGIEVAVWETVPLASGIAIGRGKSGAVEAEKIKRVDSAQTLVLDTEDHSVGQLGPEDCQILIRREGNLFFAEDRNATSCCARLNDAPFHKSRLLINDRLSIGEQYHFHFDGISLCRVPDSQGGRVEVHHLSKVFSSQRLGGGEVRAVNDMNLVIEPNEFIGILGPSGCGKSTLLGMLCGSIVPTHGTVRIDGADIHKDIAKRQSLVGIVPQDDIVHMDLTVWQAVRLSAMLRLPKSIPVHEKEDLAATAIAQLGLWEHRHHVIRNLSGGQRKRVSIAVEVLKKSSVFFLDEPSSGLDQAREEDLMILLRQMSNQGRTIICTTHVLDRAYLFSRIIVIARGVAVYVGRADDAPAYFGLESLNDVYRHINNPSYLAIPYGMSQESWQKTSGTAMVDGEDFQTAQTEAVGYLVQTYANGSLVRLSEPLNAGAAAEVNRLVKEEEPVVVVDMTLAGGSSSKTLELLCPAIARLRSRQCILQIVSTDALVRDWLSANRLDDTVALLPTSESSRLRTKGDDSAGGGGLLPILVVLSILVLVGFAWVIVKLLGVGL
jgi:ABC-type multidrug transport system ATPase subunit